MAKTNSCYSEKVVVLPGLPGYVWNHVSVMFDLVSSLVHYMRMSHELT